MAVNDSTTSATAGSSLGLHSPQGMSSRMFQRRFFSALSKKSRYMRQSSRSMSGSSTDQVLSAMSERCPGG